MKQFVFQVLGLIIVTVAALYISFGSGNSFLGNNQNTNNPVGNQKTLRILTNDSSAIKVQLSVEMADTPQKRTLGLGNRESLGQEEGMLFIFERPGRYNFWMKNMLIPIDIIWIRNDEIVDILSNVNPPAEGTSEEDLVRYGTEGEIDKVLEVNAGVARDEGLEIGDKIQIID